MLLKANISSISTICYLVTWNIEHVVTIVQPLTQRKFRLQFPCHPNITKCTMNFLNPRFRWHKNCLHERKSPELSHFWRCRTRRCILRFCENTSPFDKLFSSYFKQRSITCDTAIYVIQRLVRVYPPLILDSNKRPQAASMNRRHRRCKTSSLAWCGRLRRPRYWFALTKKERYSRCVSAEYQRRDGKRLRLRAKRASLAENQREFPPRICTGITASVKRARARARYFPLASFFLFLFSFFPSASSLVSNRKTRFLIDSSHVASPKGCESLSWMHLRRTSMSVRDRKDGSRVERRGDGNAWAVCHRANVATSMASDVERSWM